MEFNELRAIWNTIEPPSKTTDEIKEMLKENKHPVLKSIRKQFTIEIAGWIAFLIGYYTMFDGSTKPLLINVALIIAVITPLIHNMYGYNFAKYLVNASTIKNSLEGYLDKMKIYMIRSIVSRIIFLCGLMLFFSYNIKFSPQKCFLLATVALLLIVFQACFLYKIWMKRIVNLRKTLEGFS